MKAKFEIHCTLKITVGIILSGKILEGVIQTGDRIKFDFDGKELNKEIVGLNYWDILKNKQLTSLDILIRYDDEAEMNDLSDWEPNLQIGIIE